MKSYKKYLKNGLNLNREKPIGSEYILSPATFDIETTSWYKGYDHSITPADDSSMDPCLDADRVGITYLWTFSYINTENWYQTVYGRTIEDFVEFAVHALMPEIAKSQGKLVVYVHNLSYEFQYIRKFFEWDSVFCTDRRKVVYAVTMEPSIEFRCSYFLSNMNLERYLKSMDVSAKKLPYVYDKDRFPWDDLSEDELSYCEHDTLGLLQAILTQLEKEHDSLKTIPLTSTGYVRREIKSAIGYPTMVTYRCLNTVDRDLYAALKGAFVGGNTHANRFYAGRIIEDVTCYDITSSYPTVQMTERFPVSKFRRGQGLTDPDRRDRKYAYLFCLEFTDLVLMDPLDGMPQISSSTCITISGYETDNGRILNAQSLSLWCTDVEFDIIRHHYGWYDIKILSYYTARYGPLPEAIKDGISSYYGKKCSLKQEGGYYYMKSKEKLNAIYGMSAFDIGKPEWDYVDGKFTVTAPDSLGAQSLPAEPYQFGVWTTAYARKNLDEVIRKAGSNFIYCDTDSVFVLGCMDAEIAKINVKKRELTAPYKETVGDKDYYLGVWNKDKECRRFVTLGSKKYAWEGYDGTVHTVTAGVSKEHGVKRLEDYHEGYVFHDATTKLWYQDDPVTVNVDGHILTIPSSVYFEKGDYTLGVTDIYRALLAACGTVIEGRYFE